MKICIMGTGGLGGFFGGWLADSGADVSFVARGAQLQAMRDKGLRVTSTLGDKHIFPVKAYETPAEIGPVDIVLFCVKNYDLEPAAEACRPLLHDDTAVISVLNGITAADRLARILGPQHAVPGLTFLPANIAEPGTIAHVGDKIDLTFGEADGRASPRLERFHALCTQAGLETTLSDDMTTVMWSKFVGWSAVSTISCASRQAFGPIQTVPELQTLFRNAAAETLAVGRAKGAKLPEDMVDRMAGVLQSFPPQTKASMLVDLERGKRIELGTACGAVIELGAKLGIPTPINQALYAVLLPFAEG